LLAGGQTLVPLLARRALRPALVIDINRVAGLSDIEVTASHVKMGALVRLEQARLDPDVGAELSVVRAALRHVANPVIRQRGTVVGNLVANTPGAELPAVAAALGAELLLSFQDGRTGRQKAGERLPDDAMATHVVWPRQSGACGFAEISRRDGHGVLVCAVLSHGPGGLSVGVGGVCTEGLACPHLALLLTANSSAVPDIAALAAALARDVAGRPLHDDCHASATYRLAMGAEMLRQAAVAMAEAR
jgi:carbon-monoxide dehydrogenase medium subunit